VAAPFWAEAVAALASAEVEEAPPGAAVGALCVGVAAVLDEAPAASGPAARSASAATGDGAVRGGGSVGLRASAVRAAAERLVPVPPAWHPVVDRSVGRTAALPHVLSPAAQPLGPRAAIESSLAAACP